MDSQRPLPSWQASFLLLSTIWGASFMFIKVELEALDPLEVAFARVAFGAATLVIVLAIRRVPLPRDRTVWRDLFVVALFYNSIPFSLFAFGEQHASSIVAAIGNATAALWTVVFAMALLPSERATRTRVAGVMIGFLGVLILLGPWHGLGGPSLLGTLLCLGPGICYGLAFTYTRKQLSGRPEPLVSLAAAQVLIATVQLAIVTPFFSSAPSHISLKVWGCILALGALGTGLAYVLSYDIIGRAGATTASLVTYVVPLFATFFGVVLLGETLSWNEPVGALVIIAGAAVSQGVLRRATVTA
ncbi:MAG TPA: DMT family transporter [Thermoleophilaceae bacterium]|jgi:drug/metabolite transporter (DMT)-like permease